MGETPHGQPRPSTHGFTAYDFSRMRDHRTSRAGEPAGPQTRCETNPACRIPVVYDGLIPKPEASVKVLISFRAFMVDVRPAKFYTIPQQSQSGCNASPDEGTQGARRYSRHQ